MNSCYLLIGRPLTQSKHIRTAVAEHHFEISSTRGHVYTFTFDAPRNNSEIKVKFAARCSAAENSRGRENVGSPDLVVEPVEAEVRFRNFTGNALYT
jgi:hypothetical protein